MAQAVTKLPAQANSPINTTDYTLVPGLEALLLTGSGWIFISASLLITSTYNGYNNTSLAIAIDGVLLDDTPRYSSIPINGLATVSIRIALKLGAGQHTIQVRAYATQSGAIISAYRANLVIEEPGY